MKSSDGDRLVQLEERIGHRFQDRNLLLEALTHRSYVNEAAAAGVRDNGRFEFLGDAVLDLVVSRRLLEQFPGLREGELSRIRAGLVDEESLAAQAAELGLGAYLLLGRGEELSGGRQKKSLLADALEALLAAVYLDGGEEPASRLVERLLGSQMAALSPARRGRDYKSELQEICQTLHRELPRYRLLDTMGPDHQRQFRVEVQLGGEPLGAGSGRSKKEAEQEAARHGLVRLIDQRRDTSR